jgi:uncharacterized protein with von Willebrand factor type A (vWA) domain
MYPFSSLPENLAAFCRALRLEHGFTVGPGELAEAARALEIVGLSDERAVRDALRPILTGTPDAAQTFDRAFLAFFFPGPAGADPDRRQRHATAGDSETGTARSAGREVAPAGTGEGQTGTDDGLAAVLDTSENGPTASTALARASYSPLDVEGGPDTPLLAAADPAWRDAARALVHRLHLGLSRRWRPARRGRRFDLRRTLRASLQTGGEALAPRWLRRPRRAPAFVLLIDGSRSMSAYTQTALQIAAAVASVTLRVEVFTFSTALQRISRDVRRAAAGEPRRLPRARHAWGGGTGIGECFRELLRTSGERLFGKDTVVMVLSDGLDVGRPEVVRDAVRDIHRRSAGLVWLNPLLETPGYEPTASGMRAALPYVTTFTSANDLAGFARLARLVRLRS